MKFQNVILQTVSKITVFIILTFSVHLFFAGHHMPGGGFIGGLVMASALVLLSMAYDIQFIRQVVPINFKVVGALGVGIAVLTGAGAVLFDVPFLTQTFAVVDLPFFGETELATAVLFDVGVYLAVIGTAMTILLSIAEDESSWKR